MMSGGGTRSNSASDIDTKNQSSSSGDRRGGRGGRGVDGARGARSGGEWRKVSMGQGRR
jgi:hypothetical protein